MSDDALSKPPDEAGQDGVDRPARGASDQPFSRQEEKDLIRRAQGGDEAATERLLAAHQDRVFRTALRFTGGDPEEATELAQEVLISAYRHLGKFRVESRFSTWLYRITSNLAKNRYVVQNRERARYESLDAPRRQDDERPRDWADEARSPRDAAHDAEMLETLQAHIAALEPEWREVLVLRFFEDMSYEEIAETLDLPLGTVKSRINRARRALRESMHDILEERRRNP